MTGPLMGGPWGELPAVPEPSPNAGRVGRCVCPASDPCGACPDDLPDLEADEAEWRAHRPPRSTVPDSQLRACRCPEVHGVIRHDRDTCTDPVAIRLDWFPD